MNFIFKIVENLPKTEQIIVKFCRQNAPKPIDEYESYAIDYKHIDFSNYEKFVLSIMECGFGTIKKQLAKEPSLSYNLQTELTESTNIDDNVGKIIPVTYYEYKLNNGEKLNRIDL